MPPFLAYILLSLIDIANAFYIFYEIQLRHSKIWVRKRVIKPAETKTSL
jgi:hypothetical protein